MRKKSKQNYFCCTIGNSCVRCVYSIADVGKCGCINGKRGKCGGNSKT